MSVDSRAWVAVALCAAPVSLVCADTSGDSGVALEQVIVSGSAPTEVSSATGLALSPETTPQSVTVVERERIEDSALTNVNDLLEQVPSLNVERVETDRSYYNSRGFDVTHFQVDGIGLPLISGIQFGDLDTVLWDRVETVRGANGMMTGVGNPSATIDYVRKRPQATVDGSFSALAGSWDQKRIEADVTGPLNAASSVQGRLIFAHEDRDSYLDYNRLSRTVSGALLSWDLSSNLKATTGYSRQDNNSDGVLWGALPLLYSDGTQIQDYLRSASTSARWTYWDVRDQTAFGELAYAFESGWSTKAVVTYREFQEWAKLLYAYGYPDPATGLGINGMSGIYPSDYKQYLLDLYASGPVTLAGRAQELAFGISAGRSDGREFEGFSDASLVYPDYHLLGAQQVAEPAYPDPVLQSQTRDQLIRAYAAAHLNVTDRLKGVVGVSAAKLVGRGVSYGVDQSRDNSKASPYFGLLFGLTRQVTPYVGYTGIFNPQIEVDAAGRKLPPAAGASVEAGIKSQWFEQRLYATLVAFHVKQKNLATFAGVFGVDDTNGPIGGSYYTGVDTASRGIEAELSGRVTDRWSISGGYSYYKLEDNSGANPRPYLPNRTFKLASEYLLAAQHELKLGADVRTQNAIYYIDTGVQSADGSSGVVRQPGYLVVDARASAQLMDRLHASLNVRNLSDRKYLASLMWGQAFYATPRSVSLSVAYKF